MIDPVFILLRPQIGENIGTAFRALLNCGFKKLRVVGPRDWPQEKAINAAAGASDALLAHTQICHTLEEALGDLQVVLAATARNRELTKQVYTLKTGTAFLRERQAQGLRTGVLFGTERTGLTTDEISSVSGILTIPLNPEYTSLNLAQSVLLVAHTLWEHTSEAAAHEKTLLTSGSKQNLASYEEFHGFLAHLERALDGSGFLYPPEMRPPMLRNLRALFAKAQLSSQEIRTLRGVLASFERPILSKDPAVE
jgi:tRNA/rRNA methyltransferase